jgi:hypothetical protein
MIVRGALSLLLALGLLACGGGTAVSERGDATSLTLNFPDGYAYDPATHEISGPDDERGKAAPDYVETVTLMVTGAGLTEPVYFEVPLNTLTITYALPPGPKTFTVVVRTIYGTTFTATVSGDLSVDIKFNLEFDLHVNAPPSITSLTAGASAPKSVGVTVTGAATDPDNDPLTYSWSVDGGATVNGSGTSATVTATKAGTYTVTLSVTDSDGGTAAETVSVALTNRAPTISRIIVSPTAPTTGETVTLACDAVDPDNDTLTYTWTVPGATLTGAGQTVSATFEASSEATTISCKADDGDGGIATLSTTTAVEASIRTLSGNAIFDMCHAHYEWKFTVASGAQVDISCTAGAQVRLSLKVYDYDYVFDVENGGMNGGAAIVSGNAGSVGAPVSINFTAGTGDYWLLLGNGGTGPGAYSCTITPTPLVGVSVPKLVVADKVWGC